MAVALDVDRIVSALVGLGGVVLERRERRHQRGGHDARAVAVSVLQSIEELLAAARRARAAWASASRCRASSAADDGLVRFAPNLGLGRRAVHRDAAARHRPAAAHRQRRQPRCVRRAPARRRGRHQRRRLPQRQRRHRWRLPGRRAAAARVRWVRRRDRPPARRQPGPRSAVAAQRGCWETEVGENHLLEAAGRLPGGGPQAVAEVIAAAAAGDARAAAAIDEVAEWTGVGLRAIVNIFNPEAIVLGGVLAQVWMARHDRDDALDVLDDVARAAGAGAGDAGRPRRRLAR